MNNIIGMKVISDGTEQLIDLLANDTPLQLPTLSIIIKNMYDRRRSKMTQLSDQDCVTVETTITTSSYVD